MRIARCTFTMQWDELENGGEVTRVADTKIVEGLELWNANSDDWSATIELGEKFYAHLIEHAVPLDKRGIALLSGNSLALDLYALFAYRLPKLKSDLTMTWAMLMQQIGSEMNERKHVAARVRDVMPDVIHAYPHANVTITRHGLLMKNSKPSVPKEMVSGYRLIDG
jgi:hypothetical protein